LYNCSVTRGEELAELVVLNLSGAILVDILDEFFDVNCHLELLLDNADELLGIDVAIAIGLTAKSDKGIEGVLLIG
jgi:hypothetical protein